MTLYADLLFTGGHVYTADATRLWAEAVAVRESHILAVGRAAELSAWRGPKTEVVQLQGKLLLPGFTDSHVHLIETALRAAQIDVTEVRSPSLVVERIRAALSSARLPPDRWIQGGGWDASLWVDGATPHRSLLDAAAPEIPVILDSKDLHSAWVNSTALRRAGITAASPDVTGGVIERDSSGEPTGILRENAVALVKKCIPSPAEAETTTAVLAAVPRLWATGIVAIHNANDSLDGCALRVCQILHRRGELGLRVLQNIPVANLHLAQALGLRSGFGDAWLRIGSIKIFADGSLGSRTASMLQPYAGQPDNWGVPTTDPEDLLEQALSASAAGLQVAIHAIGDRANRAALDALAKVRQQETNESLRPGEGAHGPALLVGGLRHRVEHVQCIQPNDLSRLAQLDIIASVQPIQATSDMLMVDKYWESERARSAYPFRKLLDKGTRLVFGSDSPVEPFAPLVGIHAAVTRRRADGSPGPEGWQRQERISVAEAIDSYTYWPAYAAGEERYRGNIAPGKAADLALLSRNIFAVEPMEILNTEVELTVLDGQIVWRKS
jgi:hypothetical protein